MRLHQTKRFLHSKGSDQSNKKITCGVWESICKSCTRYSINIQNTQRTHNIQEQNNPVKKWAEDWSGHFPKQDILMANRPVKRDSTSLTVCCQVTQLCPTLCDPMDWSPLGSSVHGILQARKLERAAIPFSRGSCRPTDQTHVTYVSCIRSQVLQH